MSEELMTVACGLLQGHPSSSRQKELEAGTWKSLISTEVVSTFGSTGLKRKDGSWELYCTVLNASPVLLFGKELAICKVVFVGSSVLYGFSSLQNAVHKGELLMQGKDNLDDLDKDFELQLKISKVKNPEGVNLLCLSSTNEGAFVLDDANGIHEITKEGELLLKWRMTEGSSTKILRVECGFGHFIALSDTGAVYSWGSGGRGELGHGEDMRIDFQKEPKRIDFFDDLESIVKDVAVGGWHNLALTSSGDVYSWGWNAAGQLGHDGGGGKASVPYPVDLGDGNDPIVQVACGARHSAVLMKRGDVYTWGYNQQWQLGLGAEDVSDRREPQKVTWREFKGTKRRISCTRWATVVFGES